MTAPGTPWMRPQGQLQHPPLGANGRACAGPQAFSA